MNTNYVLFDGNDYGIAVEYVSAVGKQFIRYNKAIRLFKSLELAKVICRAMVEGCHCNYYISARGKLIPLSDCLVKNNEYYYIDLNEAIPVRTIFKDNIVKKITNIGYLVFEDGDTTRCDKKYGYKRCKVLMNYVTDMATNILENQGEIISIEKLSNSELVLHMKNTTGEIHIVSNSRLMDINQERKSKSERAIPFIKEMDKFVTLYVYAIKDCFEPLRIDSNAQMIEVMTQILHMLQDNIPEALPKFVDVEFSGYINITK